MESFPKKHPFTVPDRYFEELSAKVMEKTQASPTTNAFIKPRATWYAIAASLLLLIGYFLFTTIPQKEIGKNSEALLSHFSQEELTILLLSETESYELEEYFEQIPLSNSEPLEDELDIELTDLEEYL